VKTPRPGLVLAVFCLAWPLAADASRLSEIAARLAPGRWATLNNSSDASGFKPALLCAELKQGEHLCGDNILNYAGEGQWDPSRHELHFIGAGHLRETKHIAYDEAANRWKLEPNPPWNCKGQPGCTQYASLGHNFDAVTMNPATGDIDVRLPGYAGAPLYRWRRDSGEWQPLLPAPATAYTMALEYFPEMGGLVLVGGGHVYLLRDGATEWSTLAEGLPMGSYSSVASYNPAKHAIVFGGGDSDQGYTSRDFYRLDAEGKVTRLASAPEPFGIQLSQLVYDPGSQRELLMTRSGKVYDYDLADDAWRPVATSLPTNPKRPVQWTAVVAVPTYGVVLLLAQHDFDDYRVHIYRHQASIAKPLPAAAAPAASAASR